MSALDRRQLLATALAIGASAGWRRARARPSRLRARERRDLYPQGVASGDPDMHSVLLWTRRPFDDGRASATLTVEVAKDPAFQQVIAAAAVPVSAAADWTCRALIGGLRPAQIYWYRFLDAEGAASRVGRTLTAPAADDSRPVRFAFVSCQNPTQGAQNAYRRMIFEDEAAAPQDQLGFVFHEGDFIYEMTWYPEDRPQGMYDRRLRDLIRYPNGEKIRDFHIPTDLNDYRLAYRTYLLDPDLQDARARWPFVAMWDNHEFSFLGWQSLQEFKGEVRPSQTRKVAANQAWFEYQPARVTTPKGLARDPFEPPAVHDAPIDQFDEHGLGREPNNLAAIGSLTGYRAVSWGPHVELIITDQHSYRSRDPFGRPEAMPLSDPAFLDFVPQEALEALDAGRDYAGGHPPETLLGQGGKAIPNFRKSEPAQTILGAEQKAWFLDRLRASRATWKIWGNTQGTLEARADPQNLPAGLTKPWPGAGYAGLSPGDHGTAFRERAEIYDMVAREKIAGFATVAGDRHSFWAGLAAKALPPARFEPVGVAFITGSISAPGMVEAVEHNLPKDHALRPLYLAQRSKADRPEPTVNLLLRHGVRACLEYAASGDLEKAVAVSNPDLAPHLAFVDMGGHGYAVVRADATALDVEFVCIPRPLESSGREDGGPIRYRVSHRAELWRAGEPPRLAQRWLEGDPDLLLTTIG
jgi:alkaline phosphatase D